MEAKNHLLKICTIAILFILAFLGYEKYKEKNNFCAKVTINIPDNRSREMAMGIMQGSNMAFQIKNKKIIVYDESKDILHKKLTKYNENYESKLKQLREIYPPGP